MTIFRSDPQAKDLEALQQAVADAIVEADAWSDRRPGSGKLERP